jgi:hypothetical protein
MAVDAVVALTDCDREAVVDFIRRLYLAGVTDPKRLTFKGLQAMARNYAGLVSRSPEWRASPAPAAAGVAVQAAADSFGMTDTIFANSFPISNSAIRTS